MFKNTKLGNLLRKNFTKSQSPKEPFKREFTYEERKFMYTNFKNHSWSKIDADGLIILGGGMEEAGMYYITERDLIDNTINS